MSIRQKCLLTAVLFCTYALNTRAEKNGMKTSMQSKTLRATTVMYVTLVD
jgi:hypothetical protein